MTPFLLDENVESRIVRALRAVRPAIDAVRVQDAGLTGARDADILAWAVTHGRVVLTSDAATMPAEADAQTRAGRAAPGVFLIRRRGRIADLVEDVVLIAVASDPTDWVGQVRRLPYPRA